MSRCQFLSTLAVASVLAGQLGCTQETPDTRVADEQLIRMAEIEAVNAFNTGDIDGYMAAYAEDSAWLAPNAPTVRGADSIRAIAAQLATDIGKFAEVWKKHADNTWKHEFAIWNSDGPSQ